MAATQQVLQNTLESLKIILEDQETFTEVVELVFTDLDVNHNDKLDTAELQQYISRSCAALGIREMPNQEQVLHLFKHLDLNNDKAVTKDELAVFLKHLFREQLKDCAEKLRAKAHKGQHHTPHHQSERNQAEGRASGALAAPPLPTRREPSLRTAISLKATPRKMSDREHTPDGVPGGISAPVRDGSIQGTREGSCTGYREGISPRNRDSSSTEGISPRNREGSSVGCKEVSTTGIGAIGSPRPQVRVGAAQVLNSPRDHDINSSGTEASSSQNLGSTTGVVDQTGSPRLGTVVHIRPGQGSKPSTPTAGNTLNLTQD